MRASRRSSPATWRSRRRRSGGSSPASGTPGGPASGRARTRRAADLGAASLAQHPRPAEVRAVPVRQDDVPQLLGATARPGDRVQHPLTVRVVERVDQRQAVPVVEEERVHTATLPLAEAEDARRDLCRYPLTRFHGWNAFSTPRSAGASSGKWRSRTVTIELSLIQSRPPRVETS